jgi:hypothetical protein
MAAIRTSFRIIRPGHEDEVRAVDLAKKPGYDALREIIAPFLDKGALEHVSVLADFNGGTNYKPLDMFVDDRGVLKRLPRNEAATTIYRRANQMGRSISPKVADPEILNFICGPAILFDRRVWF